MFEFLYFFVSESSVFVYVGSSITQIHSFLVY